MSARNLLKNWNNGAPNGFSAQARDAMEHWKVPGLAIAIIDGEEIYSEAYGVSRFASNGQNENVTPKTLFDCASLSKSFTSAAIALAVDDQNLPDVQWNTPVSKLLPDFVLADPTYTEQVTIEDILSHRSGIPSHEESLMGHTAKEPDDAISITRNVRNLPLSRPIRTEFQYSNIMFTVASHLAEKITNEPFQALLEKSIWKPVGMDRTYPTIGQVPEYERRNLATGYLWVEERNEYAETPWVDEPEGRGAGCVVSSVEDIAKWVRTMMHKASGIGLSTECYEELVKPRIMSSNEPAPYRSPVFYALGWEVAYYRGQTIITHGGLVDGFGSQMFYLPMLDWGVVIRGNSNGAYELGDELAWKLIDELLQVDPAERQDWREYIHKEDEAASSVKTVEELYPNSESPVAARFENPESFTGTYTHPGYHSISVTNRGSALGVDASDRSSPFHLAFTLSVGENRYVVKVVEGESSESHIIKGEFQVENGTAKALGLGICSELDDLIWFQKD